MSKSIASTTDPANDIEKLARHREALERLAESSLAIAEDCQRALDHLEEYNGGSAE